MESFLEAQKCWGWAIARPGEEGDDSAQLEGKTGVGLALMCGAGFRRGAKRARAPKPIIAKVTVAPSASGRSAAAADHSGPHRRDACPNLLSTPPDRETHLPRPDESGAAFLALIGPSAGFSPCPAECSPSTRDSPHLQHPPSTPLSTLASHPDKGPTPPAARRQRHERRR